MGYKMGVLAISELKVLPLKKFFVTLGTLSGNFTIGGK